jgi:hypothetical protein
MFLLFSILGLKASYFFRQLFFGAILAAFTLVKQDAKSLQFKDPDLFTIVPTLLYPYSRFLYEEIMRFLIGGNVFIMPALILLPFKFLTMFLCWMLSFALAPIAWIYIFFYHYANDSGDREQVRREKRSQRKEPEEPNDDWG